MVRLEVEIFATDCSKSDTRFHSTMVRLEACADTAKGGQGRGFPFHNGSIRSRELFNVVRGFLLVSIPQWFD